MKTTWSGGQYSLYRFFLGAYLILYFSMSQDFSNGGTPWLAGLILGQTHPFEEFLASNGWFLPMLRLVGVALGLLLTIGKWDRLAAWLLFLLYSRQNDLPFAETVFPVLPFLLVLHIFSPSAPYGSWAAYGRQDPDNHWRLPAWIPIVAWLFLAAAWFSNGLHFLLSVAFGNTAWGPFAAEWAGNPLGQWVMTLPPGLLHGVGIALALFGLAFLPLCLHRRGRFLAWSVSLVLLVLFLLFGFAPHAWGPLLLQLLTFDPGWFPARSGLEREIVFYDGYCGLCHRFVRFLLSEDRDGTLFRLSPLESETFRKVIPPDRRAGLPDSVVLATETGAVRTRSRAALAIFDKLGGYWRVLSWIGRLLPAPWMDRLYDGVAAIRHRLFKRPPAACPILPPHLRNRFEP